MPGKRTFVVFAAAVVGTLAIESFFLSRKIPVISETAYDSYGIHVEDRAGWRMGFVPGTHGAVLVKAEPSRLTTVSNSGRPHDLRELMRSELLAIPRRAFLETGLYVLISGFLCFGAGRLTRAIRGRTPGALRSLAADAVPGAAVFLAAAAPLLLLGYGYGGFSNLVGPGAYSYSGPYFRWESWISNSSNSISYRALVSVWLLPVGIVVELIWILLGSLPLWGDAFDSQPESTATYWIGGVIVYGMAGIAIGKLSRAIRRRFASGSNRRASASI